MLRPLILSDAAAAQRTTFPANPRPRPESPYLLKNSFGFGDEAGAVAIVDEDVPTPAVPKTAHPPVILALECHVGGLDRVEIVSEQRPTGELESAVDSRGRPFESAAAL